MVHLLHRLYGVDAPEYSYIWGLAPIWGACAPLRPQRGTDATREAILTCAQKLTCQLNLPHENKLKKRK